MITLALASPITSGVDSYQTLDASVFFGNNAIPPDFFDPSSDAFMDTIPLTGAPLGAGATTDTVIQRLAAAKFKGPSPKSATVPIQIVSLSLTSMSPITVTYNGGQNPELWDVQVGLSPSAQPVGSMIITEDTKNGGAFNSSLPVLLRLTFSRESDGAVRVLDLPSLDLAARFVPWTHKTTDTTIIHSQDFCPACDLPDGVMANMFENGQDATFDLVPATTLP